MLETAATAAATGACDLQCGMLNSMDYDSGTARRRLAMNDGAAAARRNLWQWLRRIQSTRFRRPYGVEGARPRLRPPTWSGGRAEAGP
jgi:hypothetical protein